MDVGSITVLALGYVTPGFFLGMVLQSQKTVD
jgi:hypothetical protein